MEMIFEGLLLLVLATCGYLILDYVLIGLVYLAHKLFKTKEVKGSK